MQHVVEPRHCHGNDGHAQLDRDAKQAVVKLADLAGERAMPFREPQNRVTRIDFRTNRLAQRLQRTPAVFRHGNGAARLHEPAVERVVEVGFELDALLEMRRRGVHRDVIEMARVILDEEVLRLGVDPRVHLMRPLVEGERQLELAVQAL